ncbi:MAG TPA: BlaI/MecI/CopY family transcriptional regulator [Vicinamibacterales bacterium]|nr:BlaI/MecI/CopY family transcriptional regulator [Vicinamibacterales bacterium]
MATTRLTKLELQIMDVFWTRGACSVREVQDAFPGSKKPAYTTIQTTVYRLEAKKVLRIAKRISNANIFEAVISRDEAHGRLIDELLTMFGGGAKPVMAHLVRTGKLTQADIDEAEQALKKYSSERKRR